MLFDKDDDEKEYVRIQNPDEKKENKQLDGMQLELEPELDQIEVMQLELY